MVYTEYFVRGQQPTETCPLHEGEGMLGQVRRAVRQGRAAADAGWRDRPPAGRHGGHSRGRADERRHAGRRGAETGEQGKKKKRGFWARVFGVGKDDDEKDEAQPPPEKPQAELTGVHDRGRDGPDPGNPA